MRLIDGDPLLTKMKRRREYVGRPSDPVCLVEDAPTVDAAPVVHAYWWYEDLDGLWCCSHCNGGEVVNQRKYCPDCGAILKDF